MFAAIVAAILRVLRSGIFVHNRFMEIARQDLYERVWSTPILKLCEEFGLSDRGLAKLCGRHNIPRPPRGYWAKTKAGLVTKRTPLPCPQNNHKIEIRPYEPAIEMPAIRKAKEAKMSEIENSKLRITVSDTLRSAHPLVSETRKLLESAERDQDGFLKRTDGCLHIHVSKKSLHRALLLMDRRLHCHDCSLGHSMTHRPARQGIGRSRPSWAVAGRAGFGRRRGVNLGLPCSLSARSRRR